MNNEKRYEVNFDGLVGTTHNYSGLSWGNIASNLNQKSESNPKQAALQGLKKMKFLADLGVAQAVLPPQERPSIALLKSLGFTGSDEEVLRKASPELLLASGSAAAMWTANAATISPSCDSQDHKVHFTPANLSSNLHRFIESGTTAILLKKIFNDERYFVHHAPLPSTPSLSDEGAANHCRFCLSDGSKGLQLFVFGKSLSDSKEHLPSKYPARQSQEASQSLARLHQLRETDTAFARQNKEAIDRGAFHNDVVAVSHKNLFFLHEKAYFEQNKLLNELKKKASHLGFDLNILEVKENEVPLEAAISTYLFNSQIVTLPSGKQALIAPEECQSHPAVQAFLSKHKKWFDEIYYLNLRESMKNGGGPACLRLRVLLNEQELAATHPEIFLDGVLYEKLVNWIEKHYRDSLYPKDLHDPDLLIETRVALDELTALLHLGSIYPFQGASC